MKQVFLTLALVTLVVGSGSADPNDLAGGVLIAHYVPELGYSSDAPAGGWAEAYSAYAIDNAADQNNRIDVDTSLAASWFVLAAWIEEKQWCGAALGFGDFDPGLFGFCEHAPCYPEAGLEVTMGDWPGPNTGIAFVVIGTPWTGNFVPIYWFGGYAYAYAGEGVLALAADPSTGFAGTSNCLSPPTQFDAACLGGIGIRTDGLYCEPEGGPAAACCNAETGECTVLPESDCLAAGGEHHPEWDSCDPNPCPLPVAVCCMGTLPECFLLPEEDCINAAGEWYPEWFTCDPNPCGIIRTGRVTWGSIKALYR